MNQVARKVILLNATNMETFPVYPYAFIQVRAIARRHRIDVICQDLIGIPQESWRESISKLISHHQPKIILITLRNTDTLTATDYEPADSGEDKATPYFPIERTRSLISTIRLISDLKIVVGGFGFSVLPEEMMHYLKPDYGLFGGPDAFFEKYEDILADRIEKVANLIYFRDGNLVSNPRNFFPPFDGIEYSTEGIKEMMDFYESFPDPGFLGAPIEINRGCIYDCVFCSEPLVKGNQVQYREISSIMEDIEMLYNHGIRKFYMITSELNPEGNDFILRLADTITEFNSKLDYDNKITWFGANYLLNFTVAEFQHLYDSGFTGGWFDITALDDENARDMRTPYRNSHILRDLKSYAQVKRKLDSSDKMSEEIDRGVFWTMFMGNPAVTIDTIRNTLKVANREGIPQLYDSCGLFTHIRVFDYEAPSKDTLAVTYSVTEDLGRKKYNQLLPSFAYPPSLLKVFSVLEITGLFKYLGETFLSTKYTQTRDWPDFFKKYTDAQKISKWLMEIAQFVDLQEHEQLIKNILKSEVINGGLVGNLTKDSLDLDNEQAVEIKNILFSFCFEHFPEYFKFLDLPDSQKDLTQETPYHIARKIYSRWRIESDLSDEIVSRAQSFSPEWKRDLLQFCCLAILFKFNIVVKSEYKAFFT